MVEKANDNKTLWLGLAAVGALVGAALLFHYVSTDDDEEGTGAGASDPGKLTEELKAANLTDVKKSPNGTLDQQYFLQLLQYVGTASRERTKGLRTKCVESRRKHYKSEEWDQYEAIIKKALEAEDSTAQEVVKEVIDSLGISEQEFGMTHQILASNPQTAEFVMAAQQGKLHPKTGGEAPKLTKQKTLEVFETSQELTMKTMKSMQNKTPETGGDQMQMMMTMMVDQAKMQDEMFFKTGVENEEFEEALMFYMNKDPEVQKAMQAYMVKMQAEMRKAGMPGM